jgi:pilus assembly protein CpaC
VIRYLLVLLLGARVCIAQAGELPAEVSLSAGESVLLMADVRRAALGSGKVVSVATPEKGQLLLFAEAPGETTAQLWLRDGTRHQLRVRVTERDLSARLLQMQGLLAGVPSVTARVSGGFILLEGERAGAEDQQRAAEVAALFPGQVLDFVGRAGWESMVQMQVRLIEVRRDQLRSLGLRWDTETSGPSAALTVGNGNGLSVSASMASVLQSRIDLLQQKGLAYTVAEPTLSCRSGGSARFVSGGEIPIPVTDGLGATDVQYKEYGVILEVRPRTDRLGGIYADIDIELSQLDAAVRVGDFPGFLKRRTSTAFNAQEGETIAIAGLVSRERARDRQSVPGLSALPAVGSLFRSARQLRKESELIVLITPSRYGTGIPNRDSAIIDQPALIDRAQRLDAEMAQP